MLKDLLYTGLGGVMLVKDRVDEEIARLEEKGKLSREDAENLMQRLRDRGEEEEACLKAQIKEAVREVINELGLATKEDIASIKKDVLDS
jgi:polyhydroxyalkanoate synthesis regulator phasin